MTRIYRRTARRRSVKGLALYVLISFILTFTPVKLAVDARVQTHWFSARLHLHGSLQVDGRATGRMCSHRQRLVSSGKPKGFRKMPHRNEYSVE